MLRISVFMNVFNCHVNRAPVKGRVVRKVYSQGSFLNAELDKASSENERSGLVIDTRHGAMAWCRLQALLRAGSSAGPRKTNSLMPASGLA
jgi:phosphatidylserine decarboxylase